MVYHQRILQFLRFCVVGGTVAVIDLTVVSITSHLLPALISVSLGYVTGVTCHFLLNKFWVFRCASQQYRRQLALYLLHAALYWLITMVIVSVVLSLTGVSPVVARVISIPPMMLFTFCFLRFVVFHKARPKPVPLRRDVFATISSGVRVRSPHAEAYLLGTNSEPNG
jgi:putative flippase GtrA